MSESSAEKSKVLKDANDDALFSRPGRQPDTISEAYFKLREEQAYLERQKYMMKLEKELPRSSQIPPMITIGEEEEDEEGGLGRSSSLYDTFDLNANADGS
jgi:hypothetical protein